MVACYSCDICGTWMSKNVGEGILKSSFRIASHKGGWGQFLCGKINFDCNIAILKVLKLLLGTVKAYIG